MLGELVGEFLPAARIFVLQLHACRAKRIALRGDFHAVLLNEIGHRRCFFTELIA